MHAVGLHHPDIVSKCSLLNFYLAMIVLYCKLLGGEDLCIMCEWCMCVWSYVGGMYAHVWCVCVCVSVCRGMWVGGWDSHSYMSY